MQEIGRPILSNARGYFLATLPGEPRLKHEAVIPLSKYKDEIHEFRLTGGKNSTAFFEYVALAVRATTLEKAVKTVELPVFSPAILSKKNGIEWRLEAGDTLVLEFDKTEDAVMWRPECPTEIKSFDIVLSYRFEGNK